MAVDPRQYGGQAEQVVGPTDKRYDAAIPSPTSSLPTAPSAPVLSPFQRTIDPTPAPTDPAEAFLNTFRTPETADQINERMRKSSQAYIDTINKGYDDQVAEARTRGQQRLDANNAVSIAAGLMGSTEAVRTNNTVSDANEKELQAINNQRAQSLAAIYSKISSDAQTEARSQLEDATRSAEDIVKRRSDAAAKTLDNLKLMASSGLVNFDNFKASDAATYQHALDAVGGSEDALKAMFMLNRPQNQIVGTPQRMGNKYIQAYQNPITGKVNYESIDLPEGLGDSYSNFQKLGDNLVAVPDNWGGDVSKLKTIVGTPSKEDLLRHQLLRAQITSASLGNTQKQAEIDAAKATPEKATEQKAKALALAQELRGKNPDGTDAQVTGKSSAVGASLAKLVPFGQSLGLQGDRTAFEAKVNSLKSNLTLDNLKLLKGAMSDKDLLFLNSVGSSLDTNMSEDQFNKELDKIITTLSAGGASSGQTITAPDGTQIILTD